MPCIDDNTIGFGSSTELFEEGAMVGLTLVHHPDVQRVGETAPLFASQMGGEKQLSRLGPDFRRTGRAVHQPLATPLLSRSPLLSIRGVAQGSGQIALHLTPLGSAGIWIDGVRLEAERSYSPASVERGLVIDLARAVVVLLHPLPATQPPSDAAGGHLTGDSEGIRRVRSEISKVSDLTCCVLVRGESGSGKELVARAIHEASPRAALPYVPVNIAAIPSSVAASMLFGHARGAFTGASEASEGFFRSAGSGTLFLDEIGETPQAIQPALLRAVREQEIQPVGEAKTRKVHARLITATDANLEAMVEQGSFSMPLLRRIEGFTLTIPPLRERRDDIARLFFEFLRAALAELGETEKLSPSSNSRKPWLPTKFFSHLLAYSFPGNVAELRVLAQRLAITNRGQSRFVWDEQLQARLTEPTGLPTRGPAENSTTATPPGAETLRGRKDAVEYTDTDLLEALRACDFKILKAAEKLGVSRSWLNKRLDNCNAVRKANTLSAAEVQAASEQFPGDTAAMARHLEVSEHGLKLRLRTLRGSQRGSP